MEPRRLLEDDDDRFELRLLRSARGDRAPIGAKARTAGALGLGVSSWVATSAAHGAPAASKLTLTVLAKWVGAGLLGGVVVTGGLQYITAPARPAKVAATTPEGPHEAHATPHGTPVGEARAPTSPEVAPDVPPPKDSTTAVAVPRREPKPSISPEKPALQGIESVPPPQNESIAAELSALERARRALVARDPAAASAALDAYDAMPRTGVLDAEANILRVEAWLRQGDRTRAVELARRVLVANPSSAHASRLRQIIDAK